jgi:hypothetical protein
MYLTLINVACVIISTIDLLLSIAIHKGKVNLEAIYKILNVNLKMRTIEKLCAFEGSALLVVSFYLTISNF